MLKSSNEIYEKAKSGKIINISSLAGKSGGIMVGANYSASKAGVIAFTKSLARELAPYKINVNAVAPELQIQIWLNFFLQNNEEK